MSRYLNIELLKSPYSWVAVLTMLLFGLFLVSLVSPQDAD